MMKKILNWFKKRAANKGVIAVSVAVAITQLCVGNYFLSVTPFESSNNPSRLSD